MARDIYTLGLQGYYTQSESDRAAYDAAVAHALTEGEADEDQGKPVAEVPEQTLWEPSAWRNHVNVIAANLWGGFCWGVGWVIGVGAILAVAHWLHP